MSAFRDQDFDKMAERVVDHFMGGAKLADAATTEAMNGALNPDQIARLVHAANTMAFLRLMEQQKAQGSPDMTHEFDPIDAGQVVQQLMHSTGGAPDAQAPDMEPTSDGDSAPLPDEMAAHRAMQQGAPDGAVPPMDDDNDGPFPRGSKDKAKDKKKSTGPAKEDAQKEAAFLARRQRKLADVLEDQYKQAEWAFEDNFASLRTCLRRAHGAPTMEAFEKDALALHDDDVGRVVLNLVRGDCGLEPLDHDYMHTKAASLVDRHIVADTEATRLFSRLVKIAAEALRLQRGAAHMRSQCS
jgi:hypothetical protein